MNKFRGSILISIILLTAGGILFVQSRSSEDSVEEGEGSIPKQSRMDLAVAQENEITRDLRTNSVPRERLLQAYYYADKLRQATKYSNTTQAAIANVNWSERGPSNVGGRTRALMVDPNDPTKKAVWAGSVGGGLWKTNDISVSNPTWVQVNDFFSNIAVTSLASDPSNTQVLYFGTGEGYYNADGIRGMGIWKSGNGGLTWSQLASTANSNFYYVNRLVVHSSGNVYAATRSGLFRSQDGGTTFARALGSSAPGGASTDNFSDVEVGADNSIWASTLGSNGGVYRSASGSGGTW